LDHHFWIWHILIPLFFRKSSIFNLKPEIRNLTFFSSIHYKPLEVKDNGISNERLPRAALFSNIETSSRVEARFLDY